NVELVLKGLASQLGQETDLPLVEIQAKLQQLFGTVNNIDVFVGALAEDHLPGSSAGALIHAIVGNQFARLCDGDRFFYTNDAFLHAAPVGRVIELNEVSLAQVIRWNTAITHIQDDVFRARRFGAATVAAGGGVATASTADGSAAPPVDSRVGQVGIWFS